MTARAYVLERVGPDDAALFRYADHTVFQTEAWLRFVAQTQRGEAVVAQVRDGHRAIGRFTGLLVRRYGLRILGSPLPGSTTSYMGFNLVEGASRASALRALRAFAFAELDCAHVEVTDRYATREDCIEAGYRLEPSAMSGYQVDMGGGPDVVFAAMKSSTRRNVRKAEREGLTVEIAEDAAFADDYYAQLEDVFAKQRLRPTYGVGRVRALIEHVGPTGRLLLLRARTPDGTCIATGIFPAANRTMFFWGGASWRNHQILRPNEALQWTAMRYWMDRGITVYDMMGGGRYKRNYGAASIHVPRAHLARFPAIELLREGRRQAHRVAQRLGGWRRR
ncbi:MAG: GNAT family N-acetyltransferase [Trueperaceae bacterium]|nr:GNAT family N-acetyltransferase [Trueperaceae bacterium]